MIFKISSKNLARVLFVIGLILSAILAYYLGTECSQQTILVPVEKIVGAVPRQSLDVTNPVLGWSVGIATFLIGSAISALLSELYCCALEFFRHNIKKQ